MKKIYLFCSAGMSTSLLASKMQKVADNHKLPVKVAAFPHNKIEEIVQTENPDCILLGPQVKHLFKETHAKFAEKTPVEVIDTQLYGLMDGEKVLKRAVMLIKQNKK